MELSGQELGRLNEAISSTMEAIRRVAPHLAGGYGYPQQAWGGGQQQQPWMGGGAEFERLPEMIRERIVSEELKERVADAIRERLRPVVRERVGDIVRERLGEALRTA